MAGIQNKVHFGEGIKITPTSAESLVNLQQNSTDVASINYTGNPEGVISANPGSLCHDPVSGVVYKKGSGTGNTGWAVLGGGLPETPLSVPHGGTAAVTLTGVLTGNGTAAVTGNAVTQYAVVIGGASNAVASTVVGVAGQVLQSSGPGVNPTYSTATYPVTATGTGTILRADGTNWSPTTTTYPNTNAISTLLYASAANVMSALATGNNGLLVTGNTGVPSILAGPGATGRILQSNAALAPSFSTATYPSATMGTGKILYDNGTNFVTSVPTFPATASAIVRKMIVSDGSNWVASTETWAVPGTTGNVLTSNGTDWTSAAAPTGAVLTVTGTLTNAQIKALHATPISVIAAPGAGKVIRIISSTGKLIYGGTNTFTNGGGQPIVLAYNTAGAASDSIALVSTGVITSAANTTYIPIPVTSALAVTSATVDNIAIFAYNPSATEITGNAANNNTVSYSISYVIATI